MNTNDFTIVDLPALTVASAIGFGPEPEGIAWDKLISWAKANGFTDLSQHRFFGFNNPNPSPGSPNYGYEQWMTVPAGQTGSADVQIKTIPAARYAVMTCQGLPMPDKWARLVHWVEDSPYRPASGVCLEECLTATAFEDPSGPDLDSLRFLLYEPITG